MLDWGYGGDPPKCPSGGSGDENAPRAPGEGTGPAGRGDMERTEPCDDKTIGLDDG